jgi:hypothetical protein
VSAVLSLDQRYRYLLVRELQPTFSFADGGGAARGKTMTFVMLNPSRADAVNDDPTLVRCIGFAGREGAARLCVVNLYAFRATDPDELRTAKAPIGEDNDVWIKKAAEEPDAIVVAAWGAFAPYERIAQVIPIFRAAGKGLHCLGKNEGGSPRHPLYVPGTAPLVPWP